MPSRSDLINFLNQKATRLRIESIRATTAAGSGHPTSCVSAAEIMSVLFFSVMRYDPRNPKQAGSDVFILSKGHAAPILYAAWAEAGAIPRSELLTLRKFDSDLEGHPTPRLPFVDVATGSLGQGLSAGVGMAINAKYLDKSDQRIYVLMGDGESAEGAVWEAAEIARRYELRPLCATIDINGLGQSQPTMSDHKMSIYEAQWKGFGWNVIPVDGHDVSQLLDAYQSASESDRPTIVLARTVKGKGIPTEAGREGFHGKPLSEKDAQATIAELEKSLTDTTYTWTPHPVPPREAQHTGGLGVFPDPPYRKGEQKISTRKAFGEALAALGKISPEVVVLDGDVKNSTYTEIFEKACPGRFFQMYIAEQNMIGAAMGFAARGKVPYAATFACFVHRAADFLRMAAIGHTNIKVVGTHAGVSIGEDGPSQMGLEDLAMTCAQPDFTVLYPCDGVSAWQATRLLKEVNGPAYLRASRPDTQVLYPANEKFEVGHLKMLRSSDNDQVTVVAAGITVFEALSAYDQLAKEKISIRVIDLFSIQPIDSAALTQAAQATHGRVITVEDHYAHGGLGDAVASALSELRVNLRKLAVREIPHSGTPQELIEHYGISASHIVSAVKTLLAQDGELLLKSA